MAIYTIKCEIDSNSYGFYMFSYDYFKAAKKVSTIDFGKRINYPAYFLYCRALELIMKSILLATKKYKLRDLANKNIFGHNLLKGLNILEKENYGNEIIKLSDKERKTISDLNKWYKADEKKFEYYGVLKEIEAFSKKIEKKGKYPDLPSLDNIENIFNNFLNLRIVKYVSK